MPKTPPYELNYAGQTYGHLEAIESKFHSLIEDTIQEQLRFQPTVETGNRKELRVVGPFGAEWELRFGPGNRFRVFYKTDEGERRVLIVAIGVKNRDQVLIGGEEATR